MAQSKQTAIKILFVSANPMGTDPLKILEELRIIAETLMKSTHRDAFVLEHCPAARLSDLRDYLLRFEPNIVHFSGHGVKSGIILQNDTRGSDHIPAHLLRELFRITKGNHLKCVVLNACWTAVQADAISDEISCVIGMEGSIYDNNAIRFAEGFYQALGYGKGLETAFETSKYAILTNPNPQAAQQSNLPQLSVTDQEIDIRTLFTLSIHAETTQAPVSSYSVIPTPPPHYMKRGTDIEHIVEYVIESTAPTVLTSNPQTTALIGMGGIGKSVLAAAVARHPAIISQFSDGVIWTELGQGTIDVTQNLYSIAEALKLEFSGKYSLETTKQRLGEALVDKSVFLILDNVWDIATVQQFRDVLGQKCRLLVTTRDGNIAVGLGANEYRVDLLDFELARRFLAGWVGVSELDLPPEADVIIAECGFLPFAIALCGARLRAGDSWIDVRDTLLDADLASIEARLPNYPFPNVWRAIKASVDALADRVPFVDLYERMLVFPSAIRIPESAIVTYWKGIRGLRVTDRLARKVLSDLWQKSLVTMEIIEGIKFFRLHDLLFDYLRSITADEQILHKELLAAYRSMYPLGWKSIDPHDDYLCDYLVHHLVRADERDELHQIFGTQHWMQIRFQQRGFTYTGYIADLTNAWHNIWHNQAIEQVENLSGTEALIECIRCAIIKTSINSIAANYVPELVLRALELRLPNWTVERVISIAEAIPDNRDRASFLGACINSGLFPEHLYKQALESGINALVDATLYYPNDADILRLYIDHLAKRTDLFMRVLDLILHTPEERRRAEAFALIGKHIPDEMLDTVLVEIMKLSFDFDHYSSDVADALGEDFLRRLSPRQLNYIIEMALPRYDAERDEILHKLYPYVDQSAKEQIRGIVKTHDLTGDETESPIDVHQDESTESVKIVDRALVDQAIQDLRTHLFLRHMRGQEPLLKKLAPELNEELLDYTIEQLFDSQDIVSPSHVRYEGFAILALYCDETRLERIVETLFQKSELFETPSILSAVISYCSDKVVELAAKHNLALVNSERQHIWPILASKLQGEILSLALNSCLQLGVNESLVDALISLSNCLPSDTKVLFQESALEAALRLEYSHDMKQSLESLAQNIDDIDLAFEIIGKASDLLLKDNFSHSFWIMARLVPILGQYAGEDPRVISFLITCLKSDVDDLRLLGAVLVVRCREVLEINVEKALNKAFNTFLDIDDMRHAIKWLWALAPDLQGEYLDIALQIAHKFHAGDLDVIELYKVLEPNLHGHQESLKEILGYIPHFNGVGYCGSLIALAPAFGSDTETLESALEVARNLDFTELSYEAMVHLVKYHPDPAYRRQLIGEKISILNNEALDDYYRAKTIASIAEVLDDYEDFVVYAYELALRIKSPNLRMIAVAPFTDSKFVGTQATIEVQKALLEELRACSDYGVQSVLQIFENSKQLNLMKIPTETLEKITSLVVEICLNWVWL